MRKIGVPTRRVTANIVVYITNIHAHGLLALQTISESGSNGGDWHSRWLPATPPSLTESQWLETLERTIHAS
jgi:hypothetical protein